MSETVLAGPSWGMGLQFWWAVTWRSLGSAILVGGLIGLLIGFLQHETGRYAPFWFVNVATFFPTIFVNVFVIMRLLRQGFGKYRIQLMERV